MKCKERALKSKTGFPAYLHIVFTKTFISSMVTTTTLG